MQHQARAQVADQGLELLDPRYDGRLDGLDVVAAIAGPGNWGISGDASGRPWATLGR
jgi:hypothetical protein